MTSPNRYDRLIASIFHHYYQTGISEFEFKREDIENFARELNIKLPKNLGDLIYSFRYRASLPASILETAPKNQEWVILPSGRSKYKFALFTQKEFTPNPDLVTIKIPDATPGVITLYSLSDEQALLARVRYNRLIDIFTRVACYSMQNHLRTTVPGIGQVETDEIYIGVDRSGIHYIFTVQAKGGRDKLSVVQIRQDIEMCRHKFPQLVCRPIGAQFISESIIVLFEFQDTDEGIKILAEKHYNLVPAEQFDENDLKRYRIGLE